MGYVEIKEETEDTLHLTRQPSPRSWAIFIGLISIGLGAAYWSGDYLFWKLAYVSGTVFLGLTCLEDWEECVLDKTTKKITTRRVSLIQKLFQAEQGQKIVVGDLEDCVSVSVQQEEVKYAGIGSVVVMHFGAGYSLSVTESAIIGENSDQQFIADKILNFLGLEKDNNEGTPLVDLDLSQLNKEVGAGLEVTMGTDTGEDGTSPGQISSSDSDDSFEQIDKAELANMNEIDSSDMKDENIPSDDPEIKAAEDENPQMKTEGENTEIKTDEGIEENVKSSDDGN